MEQLTKKQAASQLWHQQSNLRLTAFSFGRVAKHRDKTPIANFMKNLLYRKSLDVASLRWGKMHEEDACHAYVQHIVSHGRTVVVDERGLVIDNKNPWLVSSPDGRVT